MQKTQDDFPGGQGFMAQGPSLGGKTLIDQNRVAAWWLPLDQIEEAHWPRLSSLLTDAERERAERFHFERDKLVYIAAHALCRGLLSYCMGPPPQTWRFSVGDHGKPELICPPEGPRLRINISHTRGLAAAALTAENDIGVDVEWLQRNAPVDDLAKRMFAKKECRTLASAPEAAKLDTFLTFWTLKEAYVKAIGKGLSQPLDSFAFNLDQLGVEFDDRLADDPATWHFERHRPGPEHLMALAIRHPDKSRLSIETTPAPLAYLLALADI